MHSFQVMARNKTIGIVYEALLINTSLGHVTDSDIFDQCNFTDVDPPSVCKYESNK